MFWPQTLLGWSQVIGACIAVLVFAGGMLLGGLKIFLEVRDGVSEVKGLREDLDEYIERAAKTDEKQWEIIQVHEDRIDRHEHDLGRIKGQLGLHGENSS